MPSSILLVMGPAGCGKTTLAGLLARRLGYAMLDADDLHDAASRARMARGEPLDEAARGPWLEAVHDALLQHQAAAAGGLVLACSALRRHYRQRLHEGIDDWRTVYLKADRALLAERIGQRRGHFFPVSLLDDQLSLLEPPSGPDSLTLDAALPLPEQVERVAEWLSGQSNKKTMHQN